MPYETDLDSAFTILLGKAQGTITSEGPGSTTIVNNTIVGAPTSYTVPFMWTGGGAALTVAGSDPILVEVPDAGEIVWVHLYAGDANGDPVAVTAVLDLQITNWANFGTTSSVYGSGTSPRITADSQANMSLSGWFPHFDAGDTLISWISSFSGSARFLAMVIKVRRDNTT